MLTSADRSNVPPGFRRSTCDSNPVAIADAPNVAEKSVSLICAPVKRPEKNEP